MGAINFLQEVKSESPRKGFNSLVAEADYEYGNRDYNGSINTCSLGKCTMKFDKWTKTNEKKAIDFIEDKDYGTKWIANYVDLGVIGYEVRTIKLVKPKQDSAKLKYVLRTFEDDKYIKSFNNKDDANKAAMKYSLEHNTQCSITKEYCNGNNANTTISYTSIDIKEYKTKPKLKDLPNRKIVPIHKYLFYGWASC